MPKLDGYMTTQIVRKYISELKLKQPLIYALTGHLDENYFQKAIQAGMNGCIKKPAELQDFKNIISKIEL